MLGLFSGCLVFFVGDELIGRIGGAERKKPTGTQVSGNGLGIVLGAVLDGVPESMVIGLTLIEGGSIGVAYITAVFLSNYPRESLRPGGSPTRDGPVAGSWACGRSSWPWPRLRHLAGYTLLEGASDDTVAFVQTFAGGAILTMLATTMMPEVYEHGGNRVGIATTLGFATA